MMQPREEGFVFEGLFDKGIDLLLERQVHAITDGAITFGSIGGGRPLVGRLHEAWTAAGNDVAAHLGKHGGDALDLVVDVSPRLCSRGAENSHTISISLRRSQPGQIIDDFPQPEDGAYEDLLDSFLVSQVDHASV